MSPAFQDLNLDWRQFICFVFFIIRNGRFGEDIAAASQVVTFIQLLNMASNNTLPWWKNYVKVGRVTL